MLGQPLILLGMTKNGHETCGGLMEAQFSWLQFDASKINAEVITSFFQFVFPPVTFLVEIQIAKTVHP